MCMAEDCECDPGPYEFDDVPEHDCWEYARNSARAMILECTVCHALFDRFGDNND